MVRIKTSAEIVLSLIDFFRTAQPLLDTKPGSSARDVLIDGPSTQLARLYEELRDVSSLQSLRLALGADLDKMALNFGAVRKSGSKATGSALLTFDDLAADIGVNQGDTITSKNGVSFVVLNSLLVSTVRSSYYKAIATNYLSDLEFVGIEDTYGVEVLVECTTPGIEGNISKYSLKSTNIAGINNVTNVSPFGGGSDSEDDATFRNRVFAIFGGANTGTALGYKNAAKSDSSVIDAIVIEPGNSLMTRDGTQVSIASDGTRTITSEGTGGKVDVIIYGTRLQETTYSFVYRDESNTDDPTNSENDQVLGQIDDDVGKTVSKKRLDNIADGVLPEQPAVNIIEVTGSLSGNNFIPKDTDAWGVITGNYELLADTGAYAGSPWGFDKLHWISDRISDFSEDITKGLFNGQDSLSYTDLLEVSSITQNISIVNENSTVSSSNRASIQLSHYPVSVVTRVFNSTTGERYVISDQNPDSEASNNPTGRILVSGQSLPSVSDILQVDYTWIHEHDPYFDYDNRLTNDNPRTVEDSIDWGFSNVVNRERVTLTTSGSFLKATVTHNISSVVSANVFTEESGTIDLSSGSLAVVVSVTVTNVISVTRTSDGAELWNTSDANGTYSGTTVFLPEDSDAEYGQSVTVVYNGVDVYNANTSGSFSDNVISIVPSTSAVAGNLVECTYIANLSTILPSTAISSLPVVRSGNAFNSETSNGIGTQPTTHIYSSSGIINSNLRKSPTNLSLTIAGSISSGIVTVSGISVDAIHDVIITATNASLKQDLSTAIKTYLGLSSVDSLSLTIRVAKIARVEKVTTSSDLVVLSVSNEYDVKGYKLYDNSFVKEECISDTTLSLTEFTLPSTPDNITNTPSVGDRLRVRFYILTTSSVENVSFSKSGTLYTNKKYALIDTIYSSSGFTSASSSSATLSVVNMNQPPTRGRYKAYYDYTAPKANERITVRYNYDKLVGDVTFEVEDTRPVNADVLVKSAIPVPVDVTMYIVVTEAYTNSSDIVKQNVKDAITTELNAQELGTIIDQSDLINAAYSVSGLDRARIIYFNKEDVSGSVLSITAQENEYILANNVVVTVETR